MGDVGRRHDTVQLQTVLPSVEFLNINNIFVKRKCLNACSKRRLDPPIRKK